MKQKKQKPAYMKVRLPMIRQTGGAHKAAKGGKYNRTREKESAKKEVQAEF